MSSSTTGEYQGRPASPDTVKRKVKFQGFDVHLDRPKGFIMRGKDERGTAWERTYQFDYGFIPKTTGGDGEQLDVFLGPHPEADEAYWVTQKKPDGTFDEYKVFLGFTSREEARRAYLAHIPAKFLGGIASMKLGFMRAMLGMDHQADFTAKVAFALELSRMGGQVAGLTRRLVAGLLMALALLHPTLVRAEGVDALPSSPRLVLTYPTGEDRIEVLEAGEMAPYAGQLFDNDTALRWALWLSQYRERYMLDLQAQERVHQEELSYQARLLSLEQERAREVAQDLKERLAASQAARLKAEAELVDPPFFKRPSTWYGAGVLSTVAVVVATAVLISAAQ